MKNNFSTIILYTMLGSSCLQSQNFDEIWVSDNSYTYIAPDGPLGGAVTYDIWCEIYPVQRRVRFEAGTNTRLQIPPIVRKYSRPQSFFEIDENELWNYGIVILYDNIELMFPEGVQLIDPLISQPFYYIDGNGQDNPIVIEADDEMSGVWVWDSWVNNTLLWSFDIEIDESLASGIYEIPYTTNLLIRAGYGYHYPDCPWVPVSITGKYYIIIENNNGNHDPQNSKCNLTLFGSDVTPKDNVIGRNKNFNLNIINNGTDVCPECEISMLKWDKDEAYLYHDATEEFEEIDRKVVPQLAPGSSITIQFKAKERVPKYWQIKYFVDPDNEIIEVYENDNSFVYNEVFGWYEKPILNNFPWPTQSNKITSVLNEPRPLFGSLENPRFHKGTDFALLNENNKIYSMSSSKITGISQNDRF